jgi:hypothetical protein
MKLNNNTKKKEKASEYRSYSTQIITALKEKRCGVGKTQIYN